MNVLLTRILGPALGLALLAGPALAQPKPDPDWPCVQRKVATLSPGQFWTGPDVEAAGDWGSDNDAAALAQKIASRRTDLSQVGPLLDTFAAGLLVSDAGRVLVLPVCHDRERHADQRERDHDHGPLHDPGHGFPPAATMLAMKSATGTAIEAASHRRFPVSLSSWPVGE